MYSQSEQVNEIAGALCEAQKAFAKVVKDTTNPFFKSQYATLPSVIDATRKALADNGVIVVQGAGMDANNCTVTTTLIHTSGQWLRSIAESPVVKPDPQGIGSAITYLRRYALQAMLNISSEDDDDGNAATQKPVVVRATPKLTQQLKQSVENLDAEPNDYDEHMAKNCISEAQGKRFYAVAVSKGKSKQAIMDFLGSHGMERIGEIPKAKYEEYMAWAGI